MFIVTVAGKFDIKVCAPALGIDLLVSEHATTTLKGKQVVCCALHNVICWAQLANNSSRVRLGAGGQEHSDCGETYPGWTAWVLACWSV